MNQKEAVTSLGITLHIFFFGCKVTGLVLRGIFLLRKKEIDWFYEGGAAAIYPDGNSLTCIPFPVLDLWIFIILQASLN